MIEDFSNEQEMYKYFKKAAKAPNIFAQIKMFTDLSPELQEELILFYNNETSTEEAAPHKPGLSFGSR